MKVQKTLIVGLARSGVATARMLVAAGEPVRINDRKNEAMLKDALLPLDGLEGVERALGVSPETALEDVGLVVVSPGVPITNPVFEASRARGIEIIGELEAAYRRAKGSLVAITGTNGKTTTCTLTHEIFKNAGRKAYLVGNVGYPYSAVARDTRPQDVTVCEVSSFQLETVSSFHPNISAILNITEDHLNRHKTMENYTAMKARIFENQAGEDVAVLNYDDPQTRALADRVHCALRWFSRTEVPPIGAFVVDGMIVYGTKDEYRHICKADEVSIPGPHNLENALAATAIAMEGGVPAPVIRHTLRTFAGVEHRIERVRVLDGVTYINDSKGTNVDSTLKAIETMTVPTVMILGGSTKNADMLPLAKAIAAGQICYAILIGDTADDIEGALKAVGYTAYERAGYDFERAIVAARAHAVAGGNVLLSPACASFDMFTDYEERGRIFKAIVGALPETAPA